MKRIELFEFEDYSILPQLIRNTITKLIMVLHRFMGTAEVIAGLIAEMHEHCAFEQIVDLGSGSGGPMSRVALQLKQNGHEIPILLTDLHPNPEIIKQINAKNLSHLTYHTSPVDASNTVTIPKGLKTMIASFHHMNPAKAREILQFAEKRNEPILIYEIAKNNIPFVIWLLLLPLSLVILIVMCWFMTPFTRPISFGQVIFTYLIPVIPLVYAWDGQASLMRTYSFRDIEILLDKSDKKTYKWHIDDAKNKQGKKLGYYIMGYPL